MSKTKFTQGIWVVRADEDTHLDDALAVDCGPLCVAGVNGTDDEAHANAHLIAAAPTMYKALLRARWVIGGTAPSFEHETLQEIDAALAKARGEQA